jgi:predicted MarR family transcription regulator
MAELRWGMVKRGAAKVAAFANHSGPNAAQRWTMVSITLAGETSLSGIVAVIVSRICARAVGGRIITSFCSVIDEDSSKLATKYGRI